MTLVPPPEEHPLMKRRIRVWAPTEEGQPWMAMFAGLPMSFTAPDRIGAMKAAHAWRRAEIERARRAQRNALAASERARGKREPAA